MEHYRTCHAGFKKKYEKIDKKFKLCENPCQITGISPFRKNFKFPSWAEHRP